MTPPYCFIQCCNNIKSDHSEGDTVSLRSSQRNKGTLQMTNYK